MALVFQNGAIQSSTVCHANHLIKSDKHPRPVGGHTTSSLHQEKSTLLAIKFGNGKSLIHGFIDEFLKHVYSSGFVSTHLMTLYRYIPLLSLNYSPEFSPIHLIQSDAH